MGFLIAITTAIRRDDIANFVMQTAGLMALAYTVSSVVSYSLSRSPYVEILVYFTVLALVSNSLGIDNPNIYVLGIVLLLFRAIEHKRIEYVALILVTLLLLAHLLRSCS